MAFQDEGLYDDPNWAARQRGAGSHFEGQMDDFGYMDILPHETFALTAQLRANRRAEMRNQQLSDQAMRTQREGLGNLQTYRPGGAAAMTSGYYNNLSQMLIGKQTQAPDLLGRYREHRERKARKRADKMALMSAGAGSLANQGLSQVAGGAEQKANQQDPGDLAKPAGQGGSQATAASPAALGPGGTTAPPGQSASQTPSGPGGPQQGPAGPPSGGGGGGALQAQGAQGGGIGGGGGVGALSGGGGSAGAGAGGGAGAGAGGAEAGGGAAGGVWGAVLGAALGSGGSSQYQGSFSPEGQVASYAANTGQDPLAASADSFADADVFDVPLSDYSDVAIDSDLHALSFMMDEDPTIFQMEMYA